MRMKSRRGVGVVELALVLPIAIALIFTALGVAFLCARGEIVQLGAIRAARVAKVFKEDRVDEELLAMLNPQLFYGGSTEISSAGSGEKLTATARSRMFHMLEYGGNVVRESAIVPALSGGLSDRILTGGDSPSPYCRDEGGYSVCVPGR